MENETIPQRRAAAYYTPTSETPNSAHSQPTTHFTENVDVRDRMTIDRLATAKPSRFNAKDAPQKL